MDFKTLFATVVRQHHDYDMCVRRFNEYIRSYSHFSEFVVIIRNVDDEELDEHVDFIKSQLLTIKEKPVRCELHFKKPRKKVCKGLRLHRWGDYATVF